MSWSYAHRYYAALREIERDLDASAYGEVPWRSEYAEIFGTRERLLLALRTRWQTLVAAQVEDGPGADAQYLALAAAHPGLLRALRAHRQQAYALAAGTAA